MELFIPPLCFENEHAVARPLKLEDATSLFEDLLGDLAVMNNTAQKPHTCIDETKAYIRFCQQVWDAGCAHTWGIEHKASGRLLGFFKAQAVLPRVEFGIACVQKPHLQHKRAFFDLFLRIVDWIIAQPSVHYLYSYSSPNSPSSQFSEHIKFKLQACLSNWEARPNQGLSSAPVHLYASARPFTELLHFMHYTWFTKPEHARTLYSRALLPPSLELLPL